MARIPRSVIAIAVGAALTLGVVASPAGAAKKPPVKLSGKVNNEGLGKVKNGAVSLEADSFYFEKTFLKATAGSVEVTVENESTATHTFTIDDQDVDVELAPGATETVTIEVSDTEPVEFYCRFHRVSGMRGAFFTAASAAQKAKAPATTDRGAGGYGY